ncbi:MAG: hypothetical protein EXS25_03250 [Pedosphaera sp.]|nr:hypothetical protein [Pedosphaera sp.]
MKIQRVVPCVAGARLGDKSMSGTSMTNDRIAEVMKRALDRERPPARLNGEQTADLLGFEKDDLALLARAGLLVPLGNPTANAVKYYATVDVAAFSEDRDGLDQATAIIYARNRSKFEAQKIRSPESLAEVNG